MLLLQGPTYLHWLSGHWPGERQQHRTHSRWEASHWQGSLCERLHSHASPQVGLPTLRFLRRKTRQAGTKGSYILTNVKSLYLVFLSNISYQSQTLSMYENKWFTKRLLVFSTTVFVNIATAVDSINTYCGLKICSVMVHKRPLLHVGDRSRSNSVLPQHNFHWYKEQ
jgi:hypothetical protein